MGISEPRLINHAFCVPFKSESQTIKSIHQCSTEHFNKKFPWLFSSFHYPLIQLCYITRAVPHTERRFNLTRLAFHPTSHRKNELFLIILSPIIPFAIDVFTKFCTHETLSLTFARNGWCSNNSADARCVGSCCVGSHCRH